MKKNLPFGMDIQFFASDRPQEIEERLSAIANEIETRGDALTEEEITGFEEEIETLKEERKSLKEKAERRSEILSGLASGGIPSNVVRSFPKPKEAEENEDRSDTAEYRNAFMRFCQRGTPIPAELRAAIPVEFRSITSTADAGEVIPTTIVKEIIRELKQYGKIFNEVRKFNIQGGLSIPILTLKPTATWIDENNPSADQKIGANAKISFGYHTLECKIAQTLLTNVVTFTEFQSLFVTLAVEAMTEAMEKAIFNGDGNGCPIGITKDTRVGAKQIITMSPDDFASWEQWKKKVFAKMPIKYRTGKFYMAASTFDGHVDGMVDKNGQPVARTNYGIAEGTTYRFGGKAVELVEDDVIKPYDTAEAGDVVGVFINPADYAINSNMQMMTARWTDQDTNTLKNKAILICDGKLIDPYGVLIIKKGA